METKDLQLQEILNKYPHAGITVLHTTKDCVDMCVCLGKQDIEDDIEMLHILEKEMKEDKMSEDDSDSDAEIV